MLEARELSILLVPTVFVLGLLIFVVAQTYESRQITRSRLFVILGGLAFGLLLLGLAILSFSQR